ncbi:MAG: hypothetical protein ABW189_03895 [Rickettsiales bacterium]
MAASGAYLVKKPSIFKMVGAFALAALLGTGSALPARAQECANPQERAALDIRAMQSELMVAALSCHKNAEYNRIVAMHKDRLAMAGREMREYFGRVYAEKANATMNAFVTDLANKTSNISLGVDIDQYCQKAGYVFNMLLSGQDPTRLAPYFSHLHDVKTCRN